jgi:hypothetical protein
VPREHRSKYFWPASAITPADMALVYRVREATHPRVPISELIARAIRETYGQVPVLNLPAHSITQDERSEIAA